MSSFLLIIAMLQMSRYLTLKTRKSRELCGAVGPLQEGVLHGGYGDCGK